MILSIDEVLRLIQNYDDAPEIAGLLEQAAKLAKGKPQDDLVQAAMNLRGMHDLLRSARFHLAKKAAGYREIISD